MVYMTFTHFEKVRISEVYAPKQGVYEGKQGFVYLLFRAVFPALSCAKNDMKRYFQDT